MIETKLQAIEEIIAEIREIMGTPGVEEETVVEGNILALDDGDGNVENVNLDEMNVKELKKLAADLELTLTQKTKDGIITEIMEACTAEEGDGEADPEEEEDPAEAYGLNEMSNEDLQALCSENGLSVKGKRQALIDRILEGIENGVIDVSGEEAGAEPEDADEVEIEKTPEMLASEAKVEKSVRLAIKNKTLKLSKIKEVLKNYYEGDADCADCAKGCSQEEQINCYIAVKQSMVDDDGNIMDAGEPYVRGELSFCCGKELGVVPDGEEGEGNLVCSVCGNEYEAE